MPYWIMKEEPKGQPIPVGPFAKSSTAEKKIDKMEGRAVIYESFAQSPEEVLKEFIQQSQRR